MCEMDPDSRGAAMLVDDLPANRFAALDRGIVGR